MASEIGCRPLLPGAASGEAVVLDDRLSFAMAFDPRSGEIRDVHSGAVGRSLTGRVVVMASGRGSSSASTALAESIRLGTGPAAFILGDVDEILVVGAIVARRLYGRTCPIVVVDGPERAAIVDGAWLSVTPDGRIIEHGG